MEDSTPPGECRPLSVGGRLAEPEVRFLKRSCYH
jgi:hypothetical protein